MKQSSARPPQMLRVAIQTADFESDSSTPHQKLFRTKSAIFRRFDSDSDSDSGDSDAAPPSKRAKKAEAASDQTLLKISDEDKEERLWPPSR